MKIFSFLFILLTISLFSKNSLTFTSFGADTLFYVLPGQEEVLRNDIDDLLDSPFLSDANFGIAVYSLDEEEYLYKKNQQKNFIPASLIKLLTSYTALYLLEDDFRFTTEIYYRGFINPDGTLDGDLVLFSDGDPTLSPRITKNSDSLFYVWLRKIDELGIKKISGNIIADASWFTADFYPNSWQLDDIENDYGAPISTFNFNGNKLDLDIRFSDMAGKGLVIEKTPDYEYPKVINHLNVSNDRGIKSLKIKYNSESITVTGFIGEKFYSNGYNIEVAISNPELFYLNSFKSFLSDNGIEIKGKNYIKKMDDLPVDYNECVLIHKHNSIKLNDILERANKESDNQITETVLKTIGKEKTGLGSFENGISQIEKLMEDIGIDIRNTEIADGSGLSRMNLISPDNIITLLRYAYKSKDSSTFLRTLPKPGEGTLERRMTNTLAEKNLKAKTGSMSNVSNIAGYVKSTDGEEFAFAIMFNNFTAPMSAVRNIQDLICMRLAGFTREFIIEKEQLQNLPTVNTKQKKK